MKTYIEEIKQKILLFYNVTELKELFGSRVRGQKRNASSQRTSTEMKSKLLSTSTFTINKVKEKWKY